MNQVSKLFSSTAYGLAATIFYKKSFRKDEIPVVFSLILSGFLTDIIRMRLMTDVTVGKEKATPDLNFIGVLAWTLVVIWTSYLWYHNHQLFRKTIWSSVFVAYLCAILDVRWCLATNLWASTSQLQPEHYAPTWNIYRVLVSAGIQFIRKPNELKAKLQGMRAKFGPIYIMTLTHYMIAALTVDRSMVLIVMSVVAVVFASVAGIILRPDNAAVLEALGITTTHPQRRWYHGRMMGASLVLFGFISWMKYYQIQQCMLEKECF